jgi:hypothetical protein
MNRSSKQTKIGFSFRHGQGVRDEREAKTDFPVGDGRPVRYHIKMDKHETRGFRSSSFPATSVA